MLKAETKRIKLIVISIGTEERARDFCRENEFPMEILYADPINVTYDKLRLNFGVKETLFDASTPYSIAERIRERFAKRETDAGPRAEAGRNATDSTRRARGCAIRCVTLTFFIHFVRRLREKGYRVS